MTRTGTPPTACSPRNTGQKPFETVKLNTAAGAVARPLRAGTDGAALHPKLGAIAACATGDPPALPQRTPTAFGLPARSRPQDLHGAWRRLPQARHGHQARLPDGRPPTSASPGALWMRAKAGFEAAVIRRCLPRHRSQRFAGQGLGRHDPPPASSVHQGRRHRRLTTPRTIERPRENVHEDAHVVAAFAWRPPAPARSRRAGHPHRRDQQLQRCSPPSSSHYKKGMDLAVEEVNAAGGVNGRKIELVIARRQRQSRRRHCASAEELVSREKVDVIAGGFLSNIGLALADFAKQKKCSSWPASRSPTRSSGRTATNTPSACALDLHAVRHAGAGSREAGQEALGHRLSQLRIRPVSRRRPPSRADERRSRTSEFVGEQAPPLGNRRRRGGAGAGRRETRTPSSTCCSAPTWRASCAKATRAACSRAARW